MTASAQDWLTRVAVESDLFGELGASRLGDSLQAELTARRREQSSCGRLHLFGKLPGMPLAILLRKLPLDFLSSPHLSFQLGLDQTFIGRRLI